MLWAVILLICAVPFGLAISWLARDELLVGRKWFIALAALSIVDSVLLLVWQGIATAFAAGFIAIMAATAAFKSYDKAWTRKRSDAEILREAAKKKAHQRL